MPDAPLRRVVVRLQSLVPSDFDAVLDRLDDQQRSRVLALLAELEGESTPQPDPTPIVVALPPGISPWLSTRINGQGDAPDETDNAFRMTLHARDALRACAADLMPQPGRQQRGKPLLARVVGLFV
jgi:hypothetical protein